MPAAATIEALPEDVARPAWRGARWSGATWFGAFWVGYPLFMTTLFTLGGTSPLSFREMLLWKSWHGLQGAACAGALWLAWTRLGVPGRRPARDAVLVVLGVIVGAVAWTGAGELTVLARVPERYAEVRAERAHAVVNLAMVLGAWSAGWLGFVTLRRLLVVDRQLAAARAAASEARLQHLNAQLNPHFLFNTLATVRALVPEEPHAARELVADLADHLRATLHDPMPAWCTLDEELARLAPLVAIHRHRQVGGARLVLDVPETLRQREVPSLLLQPLVENALDHGVGGPAGLEVTVRATASAAGFVLEVENPGAVGAGRTPGHHGLGLANVRRRLAELYGDAATVTLATHEGRVVARLTLPLVRPAA